MSSVAPQILLAPQNDSAPSSGQGGAKKKNKKKKSAAAKANAALAASASPTEASAPAASTNPDSDPLATITEDGNGKTADDPEDDQVTKDEPASQDLGVPADPTKTDQNGNGHARNGSLDSNGHAIPLHIKDDLEVNGSSSSSKETGKDSDAVDDSNHARDGGQPTTTTGKTTTPATSSSTDTMTQDEDALRAEVDRLRQQVEELQKAQEIQKEDTEQLRADLEESEAGREQAETQYQNLLGRVEKIKETLGERLKRDKHELEEAKDRIDELEAQNETLRQDGAAAEAAAAAAESQVNRLQKELDDIENEHEREHTAMRGRAQLSQQNWHREKEELERIIQQLRKELEDANNTMSEWEVIAMEERSVRAGLSDKVADLEEQLAIAQDQHQREASERETQTQAIEGLQRALHEIQETRKLELREMVSDFDTRLAEAEKRAQTAEIEASKAIDESTTLKQELERTSPFEREVKEKNLLIGKLRHETIVLNDHLTRALRYIKKNKPEENVDKQVVTNHLIQFLALDRSDPKKFQVLQVIAGMLQWTEEQKEKAGLARPGTSAGSLRLPSSPFSRTPSTPALNTEFFSDTASTGGRETLSELWTVFLERSVDEAASETSNPSSRKGSTSTVEKP